MESSRGGGGGAGSSRRHLRGVGAVAATFSIAAADAFEVGENSVEQIGDHEALLTNIELYGNYVIPGVRELRSDPVPRVSATSAGL